MKRSSIQKVHNPLEGTDVAFLAVGTLAALGLGYAWWYFNPAQKVSFSPEATRTKTTIVEDSNVEAGADIGNFKLILHALGFTMSAGGGLLPIDRENISRFQNAVRTGVNIYPDLAESNFEITGFLNGRTRQKLIAVANHTNANGQPISATIRATNPSFTVPSGSLSNAVSNAVETFQRNYIGKFGIVLIEQINGTAGSAIVAYVKGPMGEARQNVPSHFLGIPVLFRETSGLIPHAASIKPSGCLTKRRIVV